MADTDGDTTSQRLEQAKAAGVPQIYFNGLQMGLTAADSYIVLERNGAPVAILNCSFTVVKTLSLFGGQAMSSFEELVGREILTVQDVDRLMNEAKSREDGDESVP
jgi:hypothetical protein